MKQEKYKSPKDLPLDYEPVELPKKEQHYFELLILFIASIFSAYLLFLLDIGTNSIADLLTLKMLISALIYAVPAFIASAFLFERLVPFYDKKMSIIISLIISIPLVFLLMMWFLSR